MTVSLGQFPEYKSHLNSSQTQYSPHSKKFQGHLEAASLSFGLFERVPSDKTNFNKHLDLAYQELYQTYKTDKNFFEQPKNLEMVSQLFFLFGRSEYGSNMEEARRYFQASLHITLLAHQLTQNNELETLFRSESLKDNLSYTSCINDLPEKLLSDVKTDKVLNLANKNQLFELASLLRWLGHACQNINDLNINEERFKKIYGLAKEANQTVIDKASDYELRKEANWEMAELLYNTERFMHHFSKPTDVEGKLKLLDNVKPYLNEEGNTARRQAKMAQILNIQAMGYSDLAVSDGEHDNCFKLSSEALKIAETTESFDPFLLNMFRNNHIAFALRAKKTNFDELNMQMKIVLEYAKDHPHYYNAIYFVGAARLQFVQGKITEALMLLDIAEKVANLSPQNAAGALSSAKKLRDEISENPNNN